jgi:hypothetical protein
MLHELDIATLGWLLALIDGTQPFDEVPEVQYATGAA